MTIYPVDFQRRTEQRWARRAQLSRASETVPHLRSHGEVQVKGRIGATSAGLQHLFGIQV
jgi:hypothetical protein